MWLLIGVAGAQVSPTPIAPTAPPAPFVAPPRPDDVPTPDLAEEADFQFKLGIRAYLAGRYEEAIEHLLQSNRLVPNRNVVFNLGMAYVKLGNYDAAYRHLAQFLELETRPDLIREAQATIAKFSAEVALVRVTSTPPGAEVYVDRKDLGLRGRTPIVLALPPGDHQIVVEREGYVAVTLPTSAERGGEKEVKAELVAVLGTVRVGGSPEGAEVRLDSETGAVLGSVPASVQLPPGPHVLVVVAPGYATTRRVVEVRANETSDTLVDLDAVRGRLVVDSLVSEALIEIDGVASGFTPAVLELPVGLHGVRVTHRGYRPLERTVEVTLDGSARVDAVLRPVSTVTGASRTAQSVEDAPASVTILSREEIRAFAYQDLYDALAGTRGVYQTNDLTYEYLGFRGFSRLGDYGNRVLTTLDGHVMNDDQLGASYVSNDARTDLGDIDRIEVVRGPASALYGSNAFFGVLNLVTWDHEAPPVPQVSVTGSQGRTVRGRAGAGFGSADRGGWLSAAGLSGHGETYEFPEFAGFSPLAPDGVIAGQDDNTSATANGSAWVGPLTVEAFYTGRIEEYPYPGYETRPGDPRAEVQDYRGFGEVRFEPELSRSTKLYTRAYVDQYQFRGQYPYYPRLYVDRWSGLWAGVEPRVVTNPSRAFGLTVGAEAKVEVDAAMNSEVYRDIEKDPLETTLDTNPSFSTFSVYAAAQAGGDAVRFHAGARVDYLVTPDGAPEESIAEVSPNVAVVAHPAGATTMKIMGGRAFRAPSTYEYLYNDGGLTQLAPAELEPEYVTTAEAEVTQAFGDSTAWIFAGYANQIDHLVDTEIVVQPGGDTVFRYANSGEATRTVGAETELRREWRAGWMAALQGTVTRAVSGDLLDATQVITNSPGMIAAFKGAAPVVPNLATLASRLVVEGPRKTSFGSLTPAVVAWDATLTGDVPGLPVQWALGVRNLLDWDIVHPAPVGEPVATLPQPGRSFLFSLSAALPRREEGDSGAAPD